MATIQDVYDVAILANTIHYTPPIHHLSDEQEQAEVQRRHDESEPLIEIDEVLIVETQAAALAPPATVDNDDSLMSEIFAALAEVRRDSGPGSNRCNTSHSIGNDQDLLRQRDRRLRRLADE